MSDFYHRDVRNGLQPLALFPIADDYPGGYLLVRTNPDRTAEALQSVRDAWREAAPDVPLRYYWLDEDLDQRSGSTARWNRVMRASTLFALLIACLGLFGLSTLAAERRTKEVGIRKVLGADPLGVTALLVRETVVLALTATALGIPVGWWIMHRWLQDFASRVSLGPGDLGLLAASLVLIALFTVSIQSMRAARANPVDSLRHE
jgi:putative ABC transport system permease protein